MTAFPDQRWGSDTSRLREPMMSFSITKVGSATVRALAPIDGWLLKRTRTSP